MKQTFKPLRIFSAIALLVLASGCATTETSHIDMLTAAGFKLVNADTPKKQELLKSLPTDHLSLINWKGKSFYVQPAATPNQAYVGTPKEFHAYEQLRLARQMRNDDLMAAQMNHSAMTQWNAWGPSFYGGFYGGRW
jgi:hypothetical protein